MPKKSGKSASKKRPAAPRRVKTGEYKSLRLQKRIKHPVKLPTAWWLTKRSAMLLWEHKRLFIGITLVYGCVNLALAQGFSAGTDVSGIKDATSEVFSGHFGSLLSGISIFGVLVGTSGNTANTTASAYQMFLAIVTSLAIIWALRQLLIGNKPGVRDAFYRGMTQLVPFILVLFVIGMQLLPLVIGSSLYTLVISNGIAVYAVEKMIWGLLVFALGLLTFYLLSSSLFALYIVTLPDMTPLPALRSARELVRYRRWTVMRKLIFLPVVMLAAAAVVMVPIIVLLTPLARWVFFLLTMFALAAMHTYMYNLYRELLRE